jgi:hypothetical protein
LPMSLTLHAYMETTALAAPLAETEGEKLAAELSQISGLAVYPRSLAATAQSLFFLGAEGSQKYLGLLTAQSEVLEKFSGAAQAVTLAGHNLTLLRGPTGPENAAALRDFLPFLVAQPLGLRKSAGCGDRLGLATPGHIRAFRSSFTSEKRVAPIFAQQSIRENDRTGRTPQEVMDDAMWGVFQEGWRSGFGADADHLKTTVDVDVCAAAGYTFYTIDPGEYVDNEANYAPLERLQEKAAQLPWETLETTWATLQDRLTKTPIDLGDFGLTISQEELLRAAAKYGRAVAHTAMMHRHLAGEMGARPFELEMSVDETETVTTLAEHVYIVSELGRLGVRWVSLAPRYVGEFEKGADYIGDLGEFERSFARHFAVAQTFGPYKLSIHSGSDKFSIYPLAARVAGELVHLKTAGTSYLEALRAIAQLEPSLFREIVAFAVERYPADRASYHVSAEIAKMPPVDSLSDGKLTTLLDDFHAREILHVTFGSVLNNPAFRERFFATLRGHEETYYAMLERHFQKHLRPFG